MTDTGRPVAVTGFAVFSAWLLYRLANHAMWRDELQAWMIARASHSPLEIVANLQYEGHPAAWHLLLWPVARLTDNPVAMQGVQAIIGLAVLALIWFRSPFPVLERVLLSLSFYLAVEYGVASRSYGLGALLIFTFVAIPKHTTTLRTVAWALLGLATNTHVLFGIAALAMASLWLWSQRTAWRSHIAGMLVFACLSVLAAMTVMQSRTARYALGNVRSLAQVTAGVLLHGAGEAPGALPQAGFLSTFSKLSEAFVPIMDPNASRRWEPSLPQRWRIGLLLVLLPVIVAYLAADKAALLAYCLAWWSICGIFYVGYGGMPWHTGILFVLFVAMAWLVREASGRTGPRALLIALLLGNAIGGITMMRIEQDEPLSAARDTARWIRQQRLAHACWMGIPDFAASAVAGYLGRPVYYPACRCRGTYVKWEERSFLEDPSGDLRAFSRVLRDTMDRHGLERCYLMTSWKTGASGNSAAGGITLEHLHTVSGGRASGEQSYMLYRMRRVPASGTPPSPDGPGTE